MLLQREREAAVLDEEVVVGGRDVDVRALDRRLVVRLGDAALDVLLQQELEQASVRLRPAVLHDDDGSVDLAAQPVEERADGLQPAPGRADCDQVVAHLSFL